MDKKVVYRGTKETLDSFNAELHEAIVARNTLLLSMGDYDRNKSDGYRASAFDNEVHAMDSKIMYLQSVIDGFVIIQKENSMDGRIGLDDIVTFKHVGEDGEERRVQLTGGRPSLGSETELVKVTPNSPLGACLMGAKVGDVCSYKAGRPAKEYVIQIIFKEESLEKDSVVEQEPGA